VDPTIIASYQIQITILSAFFAVLIDLVMGDPNWKYHPVMVIGNTLSFLEKRMRSKSPFWGRINGILILIILFIIFCVPILIISYGLWRIWGFWDPYSSYSVSVWELFICSILQGFLLKWAFAIRNLSDVTKTIQKELEQNDLVKAREKLSWIVRRNTKELNDQHVISATVEVIAESSTDATNSVFFHYFLGALIGTLINFFYSNPIWLFLGMAFAYAFRIINTGDSVVGYKDPEHIFIGWASARMDDLTNFVPTRITTVLMLIAGFMLKLDVKNAIKILKRDKNSLESVNAAWTMGTMAGLLQVQLEKIGKYKLGDPQRLLAPKDIELTNRHIRITMFLFIALCASLYALFTHLFFI
jgi:adenosylcobinamide-phosphate synthase